MKGKIFKEFKTIHDITILDQLTKLNYLDYDLLKELGGATHMDGLYYYNEAGYNKIMLYDRNDIKLILPPEVNNKDLLHIINMINLDTPIITINEGHWMDSNNNIVEEVNSILNYKNIQIDDSLLDRIITIARACKIDYKQEAIALYINDSMILV